MNAKQRYMLGALLLMAAPTLVAQNSTPATPDTTLMRELVIEKEYTPIVNEATKINAVPEVEKPKIEKKAVSYSNWAVPTLTTPQAAQLTTATYMNSYPFSPQRGYIELSTGTNWNSEGSAGYHFIENPSDSLSLMVQHNSVQGNVAYNTSLDRTPLQINNNLVSLGYKHSFAPVDFTLGASYGYNNFNYYGMPLTTSAVAVADTNQVVQQAELRLEIASKEGGELSYEIAAGYHLYDNRYSRLYNDTTKGATENYIWVEGEVERELKRGALAVGLGYEQLLYSHTPDTLANYGVLLLNPHYLLEGEKLSLRAGLSIEALLGGEESKLEASPDVKLSWEFLPSFFATATIDGGTQLNTMAAMSRNCIYIDPSQRSANTRTLAHTELALRSNYLSSLYVELYGGYKWVDEALFAYRTSYNDPTQMGRNIIGYTPLNVTNLQLGARINYNYNRVWSAAIDAQYNQWRERESGEVINYNTPAFTLNSEVAAHITPACQVALGYYLATQRTALILPQVVTTQTHTVEEMADIHHLSLRASYQLNDIFTLKLKGSNLLFQHYDLWYGMPAQGANVTVGVAALF